MKKKSFNKKNLKQILNFRKIKKIKKYQIQKYFILNDIIFLFHN